MSDIEDIKMKMLTDIRLMWYTQVLFALECELGPSPMGTAHTDGLKIVIDPAFWNPRTDTQRISTIMHELRHVTDLHRFRCRGRDKMQFNKACDHAVNLDIQANGFPIENWFLADPKYRGMAEEEIYEDLIQNQCQQECPMPDISLPGEGDAGDQGGSGSGTSAAEKEHVAKVKNIVIQATQATDRARKLNPGAGIGDVPQNIRRLVDSWVRPMAPWRTVLQRYMSALVKDDTNWRRPDRRYTAHGIYLPSQYTKTVGDINIFIDASCSVSDKEFSMQVGQFKWIHKNIKPKSLRIHVFNTRIVESHTFLPNDTLNVEFKGRGGTNVREVVEYMQQNPCECNILFSDGEFSKPDLKGIKAPLICAIYGNPSFEWEGAQTIHIEL